MPSSAFIAGSSDLHARLQSRGIESLLITGTVTNVCCESTARDAYERSFNLTFAVDAMTDRNASAHERAVEIIFPRIGELGTTDEILAYAMRSTVGRASTGTATPS